MGGIPRKSQGVPPGGPFIPLLSGPEAYLLDTGNLNEFSLYTGELYRGVPRAAAGPGPPAAPRHLVRAQADEVPRQRLQEPQVPRTEFTH